MNTMDLTLSNGQEVKLVEVWDCCDDTQDCGSFVEIYDDEDNLITRIKGTLPDTDDEDFNLDFFVHFIECELSWAENY